jgi:Outer membrane lipoprotein-sorting protein
MNHPVSPLHPMTFRIAAASLGCALVVFSAGAADTAPPVMPATDLASQLSALQQDGASYVRLRLEVKQPPGTTKIVLQLQIKERRTKTATDVVYQVLWPKDRKGEAVLLQKATNQPATGLLFVPPDTVRSLDTSQMKEPLFGSDLSYEDVLENFFAWEHQAIVGTEVVDRVSCQILESKPGKSERSTYATVRSWVDLRRLVPLRVEKYLASGQLARRIDTTRVVTEDNHRHIPANLTVRGLRKDSVTDLDGSRIKRSVAYADQEFTPEGFKAVTTPRSAPP